MFWKEVNPIHGVVRTNRSSHQLRVDTAPQITNLDFLRDSFSVLFRQVPSESNLKTVHLIPHKITEITTEEILKAMNKITENVT